MNIAICTLGCKVNQYETAAMERELTGPGFPGRSRPQEEISMPVRTSSR